jgi:hypothetical protein
MAEKRKSDNNGDISNNKKRTHKTHLKQNWAFWKA